MKVCHVSCSSWLVVGWNVLKKLMCHGNEVNFGYKPPELKS